MRRPPILTIALLLAVAGAGLAADDIETRARAIEGKLMSPCCMSNTVAEHHSSIALQMRAEIRDMLRGGKTEEQILAHYAREHGEQVLAMPAAEGFNLVVWLLPLAMLVVGPALLLLVLRAWKARRGDTPEAPAPVAAPVDAEYARRLEQRLAELD